MTLLGSVSAAGVALGAVIGNLLAAPVLGRTSQLFAVAPQSIPPWVDLAAPLAMLALAGIAALVPASRAARPGARAAAPGDDRPGPRRRRRAGARRGPGAAQSRNVPGGLRPR
jgi:hypothetical protein